MTNILQIDVANSIYKKAITDAIIKLLKYLLTSSLKWNHFCILSIPMFLDQYVLIARIATHQNKNSY